MFLKILFTYNSLFGRLFSTDKWLFLGWAVVLSGMEGGKNWELRWHDLGSEVVKFGEA